MIIFLYITQSIIKKNKIYFFEDFIDKNNYR